MKKDKIQLFNKIKKNSILADKEYLCFTIGEPEYCIKLVNSSREDGIIGYVDSDFIMTYFLVWINFI